MAKDYESILLRTIDAIERNTWDRRQAVYQGARNALRQLGLPADDLKTELAALEVAITHVEGRSLAAEFPDATTERSSGLSFQEVTAKTNRWSGMWHRAPLLLLGCLAGAAIVAAVATYVLWPTKRGRMATRDPAGIHVAAAQDSVAEKPLAESASYVLGRQLVYYRTTYPPGTVVISKPQRFLYFVRPNVVAVRYAMGLSATCAKAVGLLLVSSKHDWARDALEHSTGTMPPQGEFGRYALALGDTGYHIHGGAQTPDVRAAAVGCFPLGDDDISDLYGRVAVGARVVIN